MSDHWSSPNGCHEDCPACAEEREQPRALTPEEALQKFPELVKGQVMENFLEDLLCPNCGEREGISILGTCWAEIHEDGTDRDNSDFEWDENSPAKCHCCGHGGKLAEFTCKGLDEAIYNAKPDEVES